MVNLLHPYFNFNRPSPCPLPAPNPVRFSASICWERVVLLQAGAAAPACKHLSPHQHQTESFTLKRDAGEGNQRGGAL